jgi:hypothetical protein
MVSLQIPTGSNSYYFLVITILRGRFSVDKEKYNIKRLSHIEVKEGHQVKI